MLRLLDSGYERRGAGGLRLPLSRIMTTGKPMKLDELLAKADGFRGSGCIEMLDPAGPMVESPVRKEEVVVITDLARRLRLAVETLKAIDAALNSCAAIETEINNPCTTIGKADMLLRATIAEVEGKI